MPLGTSGVSMGQQWSLSTGHVARVTWMTWFLEVLKGTAWGPAYKVPELPHDLFRLFFCVGF